MAYKKTKKQRHKAGAVRPQLLRDACHARLPGAALARRQRHREGSNGVSANMLSQWGFLKN